MRDIALIIVVVVCVLSFAQARAQSAPPPESSAQQSASDTDMPAQAQDPAKQATLPKVATPEPSPETPKVAAQTHFRANDIFHIVGVPNLKRNGRVDLVLSDQELRLEKASKAFLVVPYTRVRGVEVISGERHYGKATYGAALATPFGLGALLILHKRRVDTFVLEYTNPQGGIMNVVLQLPERQGVQGGEWMSRYGIAFQENTNTVPALTK